VTALALEGHRQRRVYQLGTADVNPIELEPLVKLLHAEARRGAGRRSLANGEAGFLLSRLTTAPALPFRRSVRFVSLERARSQRAQLQERLRRIETLIFQIKKLLEAARLPGHRRLAQWTRTLRALGLQAAFREQTIEQYLPFLLHNRYVFEAENIRSAYALMSPKDRQLLPWDPENIDWKRYWTFNQVQGIQKWVQPEAVRQWSFKI
jgi:hypothetical protein